VQRLRAAPPPLNIGLPDGDSAKPKETEMSKEHAAEIAALKMMVRFAVAQLVKRGIMTNLQLSAMQAAAETELLSHLPEPKDADFVRTYLQALQFLASLDESPR
jgi:hypothetical protein